MKLKKIIKIVKKEQGNNKAIILKPLTPQNNFTV